MRSKSNSKRFKTKIKLFGNFLMQVLFNAATL